MPSTRSRSFRPSSDPRDRAGARHGGTFGARGRGSGRLPRYNRRPITSTSLLANMKRRERACAALRLAGKAPFEPAHQRSRRACRRLVGNIALIEPLHTRVEVGTRAHEPLSSFRKTRYDFRVAFLRVTQPSLGTPSLPIRDFA